MSTPETPEEAPVLARPYLPQPPGGDPVTAIYPVAVKETGKDTVPLAAVRQQAPAVLPPAGPDVTLEHPYALWDTLGRAAALKCFGCPAEFASDEDGDCVFYFLHKEAAAAGWQETAEHGLLCPACREKAGTAGGAAPEAAAGDDPQEPEHAADHYDAYISFWAEVNQGARDFWAAANASNDLAGAKTRMRLDDGCHNIAGLLGGTPEESAAIFAGMHRRCDEYLRTAAAGAADRGAR